MLPTAPTAPTAKPAGKNSSTPNGISNLRFDTRTQRWYSYKSALLNFAP
ncbi:Uncharacterised protein [Vibrio cholerae]|nr:Uncharacterised protein [Vibrio cholerae]